MPILRCQVIIPAASTVSEDAVTNAWHFTTVDAEEATLALLKAALVTFYESIDTYKSTSHTWASSRIKTFNLSDPEPRVPVDDAGLALTAAPAGTPLPNEVAACLSFNGEYVSGASQARRRGRIYVGPLNSASLTTDGRFANAFTTALSDAGGALLVASESAADWAWIVYSPTSSTGYPVVAGWVDNAPDIQRRRGVGYTVRNPFP